MIDEAEPTPAVLRQFTAEVAAIVAAEYALDPVGELIVWLQMALRREASVGAMYGVASLERQLEQVRGPRELVAFLRTAIASIWAQERSHAAYLEAVLRAVARPATLRHRLAARLDGLIGTIEGQVLSGRTSPSSLQRAKAALMLAVGRRVQDVPEFVSSLSTLSFGEFCRFSAELEITAVHGYERIAALLEQAQATSFRRDTTLLVDVARMAQDERFHNAAFAAIAEWFVASGNALAAGRSLEACAGRLAALRADVYGLEEPSRSRASSPPLTTVAVGTAWSARRASR